MSAKNHQKINSDTVYLVILYLLTFGSLLIEILFFPAIVFANHLILFTFIISGTVVLLIYYYQKYHSHKILPFTHFFQKRKVPDSDIQKVSSAAGRTSSIQFCPMCGNWIAKSARFCHNCGMSIETYE